MPSAPRIDPKDSATEYNRSTGQELERNKADLSELLLAFHYRRMKDMVVESWMRWKGLYCTQRVLQDLEKQRLLEKVWRVWRRRFLQSCTVQQLLTREKQFILSQVNDDAAI
ncbi:uncharacterized protein O3C94_013301 [Discoglossus pictus]